MTTCQTCLGYRFIQRETYNRTTGETSVEMISCPECGNADQLRAQATQKLSSRAEMIDGLTFASYRVTGAGDVTIPALALAKEAAEEWARNPTGWLVLCGPPGTGKTHLLGAAYNRMAADARAAVYISSTALLARIKQTFNAREDEMSESEVMGRYMNAPILLLDDLGQELPTEWSITRWFEILNHRYVNRLPTAISTNLDVAKPDSFGGGQAGAAISSRLVDGQLTRLVIVRAPDYRRAVAR